MSPTTDWIQALGTTAAVFLTGGLLIHEVRARNAERRDAEAAQARMVMLHMSTDGDAGRGLRYLQWRIRNHSTEPIRNATLRFERHDTGTEFEVIHQNPIPPGEEAHGRCELDPWIPWPADRRDAPSEQIKWGVRITDARGLVWQLTQPDMPERVLRPRTRFRPWRRKQQ